MSFRNSTAVAFNYTAPVNTGPAITGYKIQWNSGSGSVFTTITTQTDLTQLYFIKTTGITGGLTYEFRIIAINVVGESAASPVLAILAA